MFNTYRSAFYHTLQLGRINDFSNVITTRWALHPLDYLIFIFPCKEKKTIEIYLKVNFSSTVVPVVVVLVVIVFIIIIIFMRADEGWPS